MAEVIRKYGWLRIVKNDNLYKIQVKHWFKWKDVRFGPYGPFTVGIIDFHRLEVVEEDFFRCIHQPKSYTLRGLN